MAIILIILGFIIFMSGLILGLKTIRPLIIISIAGSSVLLIGVIGIVGKYFQDKNSSEKSDSNSNNVKEIKEIITAGSSFCYIEPEFGKRRDNFELYLYHSFKQKGSSKAISFDSLPLKDVQIKIFDRGKQRFLIHKNKISIPNKKAIELINQECIYKFDFPVIYSNFAERLNITPPVSDQVNIDLEITIYSNAGVFNETILVDNKKDPSTCYWEIKKDNIILLTSQL